MLIYYWEGIFHAYEENVKTIEVNKGFSLILSTELDVDLFLFQPVTTNHVRRKYNIVK